MQLRPQWDRCVCMATLRKALHLSGTKSASLLSSNLDWAVSLVDESGLVETEWVEVLKERNVTRFVKAQILLYLVEREEDGHERLLTAFKRRLASGTISGPDKALQAILVLAVNHGSSEGDCDVSATDTASWRSSITDAVPILPQAMFLNEHKVMALLQMAWVDLMPLLAEEELMDVVLRRKLIERNCTSHEKARLIVDHAASISGGFEKLLRVFMRHAAVSRPCKELVKCITTSVDQLKDTNTATMVEMRIRSVFFPAASCWPGRIGMAEPLNEVVYQELYCRVWYMARNGRGLDALEEVKTHRDIPVDVRVALSEAVLTTQPTCQHPSFYLELEQLLSECTCNTFCNNDLLRLRLHKRLLVYYFYIEQDMAKAQHHLLEGYQICSRIEPDEGSARLMLCWGEYMHIIGDLEESRKSFTLAVEHSERAPSWMKPAVEGVKIDKAHFHVHRALLYRDSTRLQESCTEIKDALSTLRSIDEGILPSSHLSFMHYVYARIMHFNKDYQQAMRHARKSYTLTLNDGKDSSQFKRASSFYRLLKNEMIYAMPSTTCIP